MRRCGFEVDVDEAEALLVSLSPLEVIHDGPVKIAAYIRAVLDSLMQGEQGSGGESRCGPDRAARHRAPPNRLEKTPFSVTTMGSL